MGLENVAHMAGGFDQWKKDIGRVEQLKKRKK